MEGRVRKPDARTGRGPKIWKCDQCPSRFQRLDHMKRHALTHHTGKSYRCSFCNAAFSRGDVLRRHWKSCKARLDSGQEMPEPERGGKHKRACDSCASLKKACNGDVPCVECIQRDKLCTYQRLLGDEPSLQAISQTSSDAQNIENLVVGDDHDADARKAVGSSWDLGPATLYPSSKEVFARRQNTLLGSTRGSAINWVPSSAGV